MCQLIVIPSFSVCNCVGGFAQKRSATMCMGCASIVMLSNDGKAPDTTETIVYFGVFALWIVLLIHLKKTWLIKPKASLTQ